MEKQIKPGHRTGAIAIPASKSDAQRAYLAAALAKGRSTITGWGSSADENALLSAIRMLGAVTGISPAGELIIEGIERFPESAHISAGESGLGFRLLAAACAAHPGLFTITGEGSLRSRPMTFFEETLPLFGADCRTTGGSLPLTITGPMCGSTATVDGSLSSQFISGLLIALPIVKGDSELQVTGLISTPYVEMTLQTLEAFGISIERDGLSHFRIPGEQHFHATHYKIDADWSSASYWLVAAAIGHEVVLNGLRLDSRQADKALMSFLQAAGCRVTFDGGHISVDGARRKAFTVDATDCPDLFPALAVLAAYCSGTSVIHGTNRLVHKESHRGRTLQSEFGKLGVQIVLDGDRMLVHGTGTVKGGRVSSHNDHRIAMCLAIAGLSAEAAVIVDGAEAVSKSYPDFWKHLEELGAED